MVLVEITAGDTKEKADFLVKKLLFVNAAKPEITKSLYEYFCNKCRNEGIKV